MVHRGILGIVTVLLAGCASTPAPNYVPVVTAISFPALHTRVERSLGEDMLRQGFSTERDGINIAAENKIGAYRLSPGFYPQISEDTDYTYHTYQMSPTIDGMGYVAQPRDLLGLPMAYPQSIRAAKTKRETCVIIGGLGGKNCDTEVSFERGRLPVISERDLQQVLIYSGRVGNRVKIGYREFSGSLARAAFSNEAEYDLSASNEIAYRGAKLIVHHADNSKISYTVVSNFNSE